MRFFGRWVFRFAAGLGLLQILITVTPVLGWWLTALSAPWGPNPPAGQGGTLIVLGSDNNAPGVPGYSSYKRSYYAVVVWREGHYRRIIVSGKGVAESMRDFIAALGVPRDAIVVEGEANSTRENALYVANLLRGDSGPKALLTSEYHSLRALKSFRKAGVDLAALPFPDARQRLNVPIERWDIFCMLSLETAKTIYYLARGWI